ncbi:MAG: S-layer homology domain-containing protein [Armatimonadetes bacterium]|nr:S-layer homology domain-containing protein [Armatimonadota bacterium]
MKIWTAALACGALAGGAALGTLPAQAQGTTFPDVPANHWAYQAVQDLADKGYVKGYPDGRFLGKRDLTRYEFATVIDRIVQTVNDLNTKVGAIPTTPTGTPVTQDDLNKIQALVDSFKAQLDTIQSNVTNLTDQLDALRQDVLDTKALANKAQDTANNSYGAGANRKFTISGYVQARYESTGSGNNTLFPRGGAFAPGSYNGTYDQGNNSQSFLVRRARLKVAGAITGNTKYGIQIDTSGATGAAVSPTNQQVTVRESYVAYTFGNGDSTLNPTVTAGLFANPYGYQLFSSAANILSPERPLAFNEGGQGIWANEDYVLGAQIGYNTQRQLVFLPSGLHLSYSAVNPNGRATDNQTRHIDSIYRANYQTPNKELGLGVSYYDGEVSNGTGTTFREPKKQLFGVDGQLQTPAGFFLNAEYETGKYETRSYFGPPNASGLATFVTDPYVKNNQIAGYYVQGGWTFNQTGAHPLTLAASYDALYRSHSAHNDTGNIYAGTVNSITEGYSSGGGSYDDTNLGYGVLYNLDRATRLRVWYEQPFAVAHAYNAPTPQRIGLFTTELQVKF